MADEHKRMECPDCGFKCVPQWMNDQAHCLKCDAVMKRRASCHNKDHGTTHAAKALPSYAASSAMESVSGQCSKSPDGMHHWKFGQCQHCKIGEGKFAHGAGAMANPGGGAECSSGGKCIFKFAKCTKCGRREGVLDAPKILCPKLCVESAPGPSGYAASSAMEAVSGVCERSPDGRHHWKFGQCQHCHKAEGTFAHGAGAMSNPGGAAECAKGGKCMFKFARCSKCGCAEGALAAPAEPRRRSRSSSTSRPASRLSSHDPTPNVELASSPKLPEGNLLLGCNDTGSGHCAKSPDGQHHWKFGQCQHCHKAEGKFASGAGAMANPGGSAPCSKGGKCVFKFAKCTKCGRREGFLDDHTSYKSRGRNEDQYAPSSAMESASGTCPSAKSQDGQHHWKFGRCQYCNACEGKLVAGAGVMADPGAVADCDEGGKCMFKFAKCTKCGRREGQLANQKQYQAKGHSSDPYAANSAMESTSGSCSKSPDGQHHWKFGQCSFCRKGEGAFENEKFTKVRSDADSASKKMAAAFRKFDTNGDGVISREELRAVLSLLFQAKDGCSDSKVESIVNTVDINGDGEIDYFEFVEWMSHPGDGAEILDRMRLKKTATGNAKVSSGSRPTSNAGTRNPASATMLPPLSKGCASKTQLRGPERFFYDKSSYTGTHQHGGA